MEIGYSLPERKQDTSIMPDSPSDFPRVYRTKISNHIGSVLVTILIFTIAVIYMVSSEANSPRLWGLLGLAGLWITVDLMQLRFNTRPITLHHYHIERKNWLSIHKWSKKDISFISKHPDGYLYLVHRLNKAYCLQIPQDIDQDEIWKQWFIDIPVREIESPSLKGLLKWLTRRKSSPRGNDR